MRVAGGRAVAWVVSLGLLLGLLLPAALSLEHEIVDSAASEMQLSGRSLLYDYSRKHGDDKEPFELIGQPSARRWKHPLVFPVKPPKKVETLVIANLMGGVGGLCDSDDWRGDLPRQLARLMPETDVLIWYNARTTKQPHCFICKPEGRISKDSFYCDEYMRETVSVADALLLVGRGPKMCQTSEWGCDKYDKNDMNAELRYNYTSMFRAIAEPWVTSSTWVMNIPVGGDQFLEENYFGFSRVVSEVDFVKPISQEALSSVDTVVNCAAKPKQNYLIFTGAYGKADRKGQKTFLENVDPEDVRGFKLYFFGGELTDSIKEELQHIADQRGIDVAVSGTVTHRWMVHYICYSKGMIVFSKYDVNPRSVYEGLPAGNPVYISGETLLPEGVWELPYVFSDSNRDSRLGRGAGLPGFKLFMHAVRSADIHYHLDVKNWALRMLDHDTVYRRICEELGLCEPTMY
mmetsp:Transcript_14684/g.41311  ORF Transcript_14684/g.41311 Transcript_14684/m.41311 type:complete len:461 (-) Transcript_14684:57-1439(-)